MTVRIFRVSLLPGSARRPALIRRACLKALRSEKADKPGELNVVFLDRTAMRRMNRAFLRHDYDTDVIAFRHDAAARDEDVPFGDVYISAHQARRQATQLGHSVLEEAITLAVHGTLHLLGYDDRTPRQRALMFKRQDDILRRA